MRTIILDGISYNLVPSLQNLEDNKIKIKIEYPRIISFVETDNNDNIWELNYDDDLYYYTKTGYEGYDLHHMLYEGNCVNSGFIKIYQIVTNPYTSLKLGDLVKVKNIDGKTRITDTKFCIDKFIVGEISDSLDYNPIYVSDEDGRYFINVNDVEKVVMEDIEKVFEVRVSEAENEKSDYPKILSFLRKDSGNTKLVLSSTSNKYHYENEEQEHEYSLDDMLHKNCCVDTRDFKIYEVQANSDTIFKIGDRVKYFEGNCEWKIDNFFCREKDGVILARSLDCNDVEDVLTIRNVQPLFTSEDGVDIYDGDYFHAVQKSTFHIINDCYQYPMDRPDEWILFSSIEEAEKYAENHKKKFSVDDIKTVVDKFNNHEIWKYLGFEKYLKNEFGIDDI